MTTATTPTSNNSILQSYLDQQSKNIAAAQASTSSSSSSSSSASQGVFQNESTFLNILTTQLQNQDPTEATDTNAFTQELVEFAQVEQQLNTNSDLQSLISLQKGSSGVTAALSYMNGYAEVPTTTGQLPLQNGVAEVGYTLPTAAQNAIITIKDSSGNTVTQLSGSTNKGLNYAVWNGEDSSGNKVADGAYTFSISAADATTGQAETITDTRFIGQVTGVTSNSDGSTNLSMGGISIPTSTVDAVYMSSTVPQATTTATANSYTSS